MTASLTNVAAVGSGSGTITSSHSNQQQILLAATQVSGMHPGSGYGKPSGLTSSNSVRAAYGHNQANAVPGGGAAAAHLNQISKLSPTGGGSRLSQGAHTVFPAK